MAQCDTEHVLEVLSHTCVIRKYVSANLSRNIQNTVKGQQFTGYWFTGKFAIIIPPLVIKWPNIFYKFIIKLANTIIQA